MKKAQQDIMGLVIIAVIASLILLFAITSLLKPADTTVEENLDEELASNTINALLKTSSGCVGERFDTLFKDCARYLTEGGTIQCGSGQLSCAFLQDRVPKLLDTFLNDSIRKSYNFSATVPVNRVLVDFQTGERNPRGRASTENYPLPLFPSQGEVSIRLTIFKAYDVN